VTFDFYLDYAFIALCFLYVVKWYEDGNAALSNENMDDEIMIGCIGPNHTNHNRDMVTIKIYPCNK
jgi:hypothetical protein